MKEARYKIIRGGEEGEGRSARFSIAQAGVVHSFERRLSMGARIGVFVALSWLPVAIFDGLLGNGLLISQLWVNIPLLIVGPLLITAEKPIETRIRMAIEQLQDRDIIQDQSRLDAVLDQGKRALSGRVGNIVELGILAIVAFAAISGLGGLDPRRTDALAGASGPTLIAANWFAWVSLSLLLFLRLRWVWRGFVWVQALWRISRYR